MSIICVGFLLLGFAIVPSANVANDEGHPIEVGDYWEYSISEMDLEGMEFDFSIKITVESVSTMSIGGQDKEIFILDISGDSEFSETIEGVSMEGTISISGEEKRLVSNFDLISTDMEFSMDIEAAGAGMDFSMEMSMVMETSYVLPIDDYIGDDALETGTIVASTSSMTMESTTTFMGEVEASSEQNDVSITMEIVETGVTVETPAGTFDDCCKVIVITESDDESSTSTQYYSGKVGNYVKITGDAGEFSVIPGEQIILKSYGHGGGLASLFTGDNLWITLVIILVIVVVLAAIIAVIMRRGRGPVTTFMPPMIEEAETVQTTETEPKPPITPP
ncbi:MAG TPA: hypothetical protein ENN25_06975 [Euryarchaeota archaeon]|nr:hypothetical protein [Euryarchaeota archaeon]